MILLDSTRKLEAVLSGAPATTQPDFVAEAVQFSSTFAIDNIVPNEGAMNGVTAVDLVTAPAAGKFRQVKFVSIYNRDTANVTVTVRKDISATKRIIGTWTLAPGDCLSYSDGRGWLVLNNAGSVKQANAGFADLEFLGSTRLAGAAVSTGALTIAARDELLVKVIVTGYSGADIASLRFNGDAGANYNSRYIHSVAGGVVLTNNQNVSQTLMRLFAIGVTTARSAWLAINNRLATAKGVQVNPFSPSGAAGTAPGVEFGGGEWVNTAAQITSIEMRTAGGANTLSAGSGLMVWGRNY